VSVPVADSGPLHMIYPYAAAQQYLDGAAAYIEQARASGAAVVIAAPQEHREALTSRIGTSDEVTFLDVAALGRNPALLLYAWQERIGQHADGRAVHGINDTARAGADARYSGEARYTEWLLNLAFAKSGAWSLLCPVDTGAHPAPEVEALTRCHPLIWNGTAHTPAADYLTGSYAFDELPAPPPGAERLCYGLETLGELRVVVTDFARRHRMPAVRTTDLALVASEVASNSIRYGGGRGMVHLWRNGDSLVCEFRDEGVITDPLAGRLRPPPGQLGGRGLWFVNQLCDLVQLRSEAGHGTRIRLWMDLPSGADGSCDVDSAEGRTSAAD